CGTGRAGRCCATRWLDTSQPPRFRHRSVVSRCLWGTGCAVRYVRWWRTHCFRGRCIRKECSIATDCAAIGKTIFPASATANGEFGLCLRSSGGAVHCRKMIHFMPQQSPSEKRITSLDGLRAVSIGLVLVSHLFGTQNFFGRNAIPFVGNLGKL